MSYYGDGGYVYTCGACGEDYETGQPLPVRVADGKPQRKRGICGDCRRADIAEKKEGVR